MNIDTSRLNSYVNNIVTKIFNSINNHKIEDIDHFISDKIYKKTEELIKKNNNILSDLNIKESYMINIKEKKNKTIIEYYINISYLEKSSSYKEINREYKLIFEKSNDTKEQNISRKCPNCGSNMDINNSGKCDYCGSIYDLENYDFILVNYKKI